MEDKKLYICHFKNYTEFLSEIFLPDTDENWNEVCDQKIKWEMRDPRNVCWIGWDYDRMKAPDDNKDSHKYTDFKKDIDLD